MNVQGMNATAFPSDPTTMNNFNNGMTPGSGDRPFSLLPLAMQVAAQTVGLDLVPVVPMQGPMGVLTYLDFVYGGGRIQDAGGKGTDSAPLLVKCGITAVGGGALALNVDDVIFAQAAVTAAGGTSVAPYELTFVGLSRIDGKSIFRVRGNDNAAAVFANTPAPYQQGEVGYEPIYTAIADNVDFYNLSSALAGNAAGEWDGAAELVKALEDHISGFSGNAFESSNVANAAPSFTAESIDGTDPYQRGVGESTPDNIMGLSLFNKSIAAKTFQVAAAVTREQVQDLKQFGIDAVAQV
jgi:hypothetical protein